MFTVADPKPPVGDGKGKTKTAAPPEPGEPPSEPASIDLAEPSTEASVEAPASAPVAPEVVPRPEPGTVRRVRRVTTHLDTASVLKVAAMFFACLAAVGVLAATMVWVGGSVLGVVANVERLMSELGFRNFQFRPLPMLQAAALLSGGFVVMGTAATVLTAILYNLISDLVGGVQMVEIDHVEAEVTPAMATEKIGSVV